MKKIMLLAAAVALLASMTVVPLSAQTVTPTCPTGTETIEGNKNKNEILDKAGDQCYNLRAEKDTFMNPGDTTEGDTDTVFGGKDNDQINLVDGDGNDVASCGDGTNDTAVVEDVIVFGEATISSSDSADATCENVYHQTTISGGPAPPATV